MIKRIISDEWTYQNLSLSILFILSGAEAVVSSAFTYEQLAKVHIFKEKEKTFPIYGFIAIFVMFIGAAIMYFFDNNVYFLLITILIITILGLVYELSTHPKRKIIFISYVAIISAISLTLCYFAMFKMIPLVLILPFFILSIVKVIIFIYNNNKELK